MSEEKAPRHPFLDDLAPDAELRGTTLRRTVKGRDNIRRLVETTGSLYASQKPLFLDKVGNRSFLGYEATLSNGRELRGVVVIDRDDEGTVHSVSVTFSLLSTALSLSARQGALLEEKFGSDLFI